MPETLQKLRPDRDFQCYFERPSAIAAISDASESGFTVSGSWRQQFDWAVIEWNRDNTFEHPLFRNLPDGDLSGLLLTYDETRDNCIPVDSNLYPTVDWPYLRVWAPSGGVENVYKVSLKSRSTAIEGSYASASAEFELQGSITAGDYVELAWTGEHHSYQILAGDTLQSAAQSIVDSVNAFSPLMSATRTGARIALQMRDATTGANANRMGVYANVSGANTESWSPSWQKLSGGTSPTKWRVSINFASLTDTNGVPVPTTAVRKLRWTYAAELQAGAFQRSEFQVVVSNWTVTGTNRTYEIAGPGSRRIEDDDPTIVYSGSWTSPRGNFSGGSIAYATSPGASVTCAYTAQQNHRLYLGARKAASGAQISVSIDGQPALTESLVIPGEDVLLRIPLGLQSGGAHSVIVTHAGTTGSYFYFDFMELVVPTTALPVPDPDVKATLATDWDTDHSIALAPERTAWLIESLGFRGRANHYVGALWFYELVRQGHSYATGTIEFSGAPVFGETTSLAVGLGGPPTVLQHLNLIGDTAASIAKALELEINNGYTGIWAESSGAVLTIHARAMGAAGNTITLSVTPSSGAFHGTVSGATFTGGVDGEWRTDLAATPRINRAVRDWSRSLFKKLKAYGIDVAAAFSMELQHGDPSVAAGIAQRYPSGNPVLLNTPALQTNFSPASFAFWKVVYRDMAQVMQEAGVVPYLQFGEVQWWYFPYDASGLPFYDTYTTTTFQSTYGHPLHVFVTSQEDPAQYPHEAEFLPALIGAFTNAIIDYVHQTHASTRFEVLYPPDVNDSPLNRVINLPVSDWTPAKLDNLKTENFTFTGDRNLNKCRDSVLVPIQLGFARNKSSHLVGIGDYTTPWLKEIGLSKAENVESVVLFALDQFCLIGYPAPLPKSDRRSGYSG